jgi:putative addiction module component (TIGR02574 family)
MQTVGDEAAMSTTLEILQAQVLSLSKEDRARLLERLVASLDVDAEAEEAWEQLAAQREAEFASGSVIGIPLEDAMAQLRARFPG